MSNNPITELYVDNGNEFVAIDPKTVAKAVVDQTNKSEVQKFIDGGIKGWDEVKTGNEFVAASFVHENFNNIENKYNELDSNSMRYIGNWVATEQIDFSGIQLPVKRGYVYKIIGFKTTIDDRDFEPGNFIVIKRNVSKPGKIDSSDVDIIGAGGGGGLGVDHVVLDAFETKAELNEYEGGLPNCIVIVANDEDHHGYLSFYNYLESEISFDKEVNTYAELMALSTFEIIPAFEYNLDTTTNIITLNTYIDSLLEVPAPIVNYVEYGYIVKVISDESRNDLTTYYKWNGQEWVYLGNSESKWFYMFSHIDPISLDEANALIDEITLFRNELKNYVTYNDFNNEINRIDEEIAGISTDNFATKDELHDYTLKSYADETFATKEEISLIPQFDIKVVSQLPTEDISTTTIYLISAESTSSDDIYDEYIYVDNKWEKIGSGRIDSLSWGNITGTLSNQTDLQNALDGKQDTLIAGDGININNGVISATANSAEWGNITGTLSEQTDLQGALDDKSKVSMKDWIKSTSTDLDELVINTLTQEEYNELLENDEIDDNELYMVTNADTDYVKYSELANVATTGDYNDLTHTPNLANVATTGDYNDLINTPTIPVIPTLANVATTGDYNDLTNTPTIPESQVQSDWNETDTSSMAFILNKPTIPAGVIVDQNYDPLSNNAQSGVAVANAIANKVDNSSLANVATTGDYNDLINTPTIPVIPTLANVATTGDYNDLTNTPTIPESQVQSDWNETDTSSMAFILNKPTIPVIPTLSTVATTGDYADLTNTPTIPVIPTLSTVATTGEYSDLLNKPTIPAAQVQSDWNATTGMGVILNKPTLANIATSGDYNDLTNTPTIPVIPILANVATTGDYNDLINTPIIPPSIVVDQTYNASSANAQSGVAVAEAISNVSASSSWGNITGTLSDQTDLQTALDDKSKVSLALWENSSSTSIDLDKLVINKLTQEEYDELLENDEIDNNELYMITDIDTDYVRPSDLQSILDRLDVIEDAISNLTDRVEALEQGGGGSGVYEAQMTLQNVIESGEQPSIDTVEDEVNPILEDILGE